MIEESIELFLSTDGKHTVHISADSPEKMEEISLYAMRLYETVLRMYGSKAEMWRGGANGETKGETKPKAQIAPKAEVKPQVGTRIDTVEQAKEATSPKCPVHGVPMVYRQGKYGNFWSCPTKKPDGEWCKVTR